MVMIYMRPFKIAVIFFGCFVASIFAEITTRIYVRPSDDERDTTWYTHPIVQPNTLIRLYIKTQNTGNQDTRVFVTIKNGRGQILKADIPVHVAAQETNDTVWADVSFADYGNDVLSVDTRSESGALLSQSSYTVFV
jgi:hypothetical protein